MNLISSAARAIGRGQSVRAAGISGVRRAPACPVSTSVGVAAFAIALCSAGSSLHAQSCGGMQDLGTLPGDTFSGAYAVSANGSVVVGWSEGANGKRAMRGIAAGAMQGLGSLPGMLSAEALAVSSDGSVAVGRWTTSGGSFDFVWNAADGISRLGTPGWSFSAATGVSSNGNVVVGIATQNGPFPGPYAARWTEAQGIEGLGTLIGGSNSEATGVSADGSVVVGWSSSTAGSRAFRWTAAGGMQDLGTVPGHLASQATGVSADGSVVVGWSALSSGTRAFRWTAGGGMRSLGVLPGGTSSFATAASADGSVIVGWSRVGPDERAFRWTAAGGMQSLGTLPGATTSIPYGVSADGSVVVGVSGGSAFRWGVAQGETDTDGDGLLDDWECNGIPYPKSDGTQGRYILDSNGDGVSDANWLRKDLFVEVDAMSGRGPSAGTLQGVVDAFDTAPVPAPQGVPGALPGIRLHIVIDQGDQNIPLRQYTDPCCGTCAAPWPEFDQDKNGSTYGFGTDTERVGPDAAAILAAKRKAYRYCIFADRYCLDPNQPSTTGRSSGIARGIPSAEFMVTLGAFPTPGGTPEQQAATFMHELGHTLGLGHGGGDDINFKPNYYSIMNYWWQFRESWQNRVAPATGTAWGLRYSSATLPTLNENALNEAGIGAAIPGARVPFTVVPIATCPDITCNSNGCFGFASLEAGRRVDWNGDCSDQTPGTVAMNLNANYDNALTELRGHDDWANIVYDFKNSPTFAPGAPPERIDCNFTPELLAFLDSLQPPVVPCAACAADFDHDGGVTGSDIGAFFVDYEAGNPCADVDQDGGITGGDLEFFFMSFEAGGCD